MNTDLDVQLRAIRDMLGDDRLPLLVADNESVAALLDSLLEQLPGLARRIDETIGRPPPTDLAAAHHANVELRQLLSLAVDELPDDSTGDAGRAAIAAQLSTRLAAERAFNRERRK